MEIKDKQSDLLTLPLEEGDEDTLQQLQGRSITYLIAMGPHHMQGAKCSPPAGLPVAKHSSP